MTSMYMSMILSPKSIQYMKGTRNHLKTEIWTKPNINQVINNFGIFLQEYIPISLIYPRYIVKIYMDKSFQRHMVIVSLTGIHIHSYNDEVI